MAEQLRLTSVALMLYGAAALDYNALPTGAALDSLFARAAPGELQRQWALSNAPSVPFKPFSARYVQKALAAAVNWTARGAVTPVKNQGPHGYCGTFGRVASAEGQFALNAGRLVSFSEEMLVDCIGWDKDQ